ncbi:MAG: M28 family peptidase [Bacteroidia bacterium]
MSYKCKFSLLFLLPVGLFAQQKDTLALRFAQQISSAVLKKHLEVLASDAYEGRETGRKGQKMAADYIKAEFRRLNLKPGNDTSFLQSYPLVVRKPGNITLSIAGSPYVYRKDFYTSRVPDFHDQTYETGELYFLGYGINDSASAFNDYQKTSDLKGKTIVVFKGEPVRKDGKYLLSGTDKPGDWTESIFNKLNAARKAGVKTMLIVSAEDPSSARFNGKGGGERMQLPIEHSDPNELVVLYVSAEMGNRIMGTDLSSLLKKRGIKRTNKPYVHKALLKLQIQRDDPGYSGENVIGILEGTTKKKEYLFITAHYDHLGIINGEVYNGADDDGSGTVTVLNLARAFVKARESGHGPERSIVFMTFSGEEKGLLGSEWFVDHPCIALENIVCDLNIDMIGRVDDAHIQDPAYVYVIGSDKLSSRLHAINENANATYSHLKLDYTYNDVNDPNRFYYRSDHYNFAKNNIPVIFYFNGTHADYHKETDEIQKINFELMEQRARLVFFTAWELVHMPERITVDSHKK